MVEVYYSLIKPYWALWVGGPECCKAWGAYPDQKGLLGTISGLLGTMGAH